MFPCINRLFKFFPQKKLQSKFNSKGFNFFGVVSLLMDYLKFSRTDFPLETTWQVSMFIAWLAQLGIGKI